MVLEIILALLIGVLIGTFTGITPGIHINLVSAMLLSFSAIIISNYGFPPIALVVFLVSVAMTHTFVDYIPSIFLGAPDEDNFLSILPGHQMLIKGEAYSAVVYTLYGGLAALVIILIFTPIFILFLPFIYLYAQRIMPFILILASLFLIYFEKSSKIWALIIFILSGIFGISVFNLQLENPLLPMFTGLFGLSSLLTSITKKQKIPEQKIQKLRKITLKLKSFFKSVFASVLASPLCSFLPGLGSGQAAVIGSEIMGDLNKKEFLVLLGAINTIVTGLSFITLYTINKTRTGVAVAVSKLITMGLNDLIIIVITMFLSGLLSFFIAIYIARIFSKIISKISYFYISIVIIFILICIVFFFSGWLGILISLIASSLGIVCIKKGIRRTHMMGCLLIPTILYYLL